MAEPESRHCAFLTFEDRADFCIYDHYLFTPLSRLGWQAEEIPWNRAGVDWARFDAVLIRSTWDYQNHLPEFMATLERIERVSCLLNSVAVCRWNSDKRYLLDLQERGVPIVPTVFQVAPQSAHLDQAFSEFATEQVVLKPVVGANADDTFVLESGASNLWQQALKVHEGRVSLIQPFLDAILSEGEYSLFYFGGQFSHAIRKQPAPGDFRVQEEHGGIIQLITPAEDLLAAGGHCMDHCTGAVGEELLYARVDLVRLASGELAVMEVELIEPSLYFDQDPSAAERFAHVFDEMMNERTV